MSALNNKHGFRVLGPKDTVEFSGDAVVVKHGSTPQAASAPIFRLRQNLLSLNELHARLKKMLAELEELVK